MSFYPALVRNRIRYSKRWKWCSDCVKEFTDQRGHELEDGLILRKNGQQPACHHCGLVITEDQPIDWFYLTAFGDSNKRYDYQSRYCQPCGDTVLLELGLEMRNGQQ